MAYEPKPGDGALFINDRKGNDRAPSAKGYIVMHRDVKAGEKLDLAAWTKEGSKGRFQSLKVSDMRGSQERREDRPDYSDDPF